MCCTLVVDLLFLREEVNQRRKGRLQKTEKRDRRDGEEKAGKEGREGKEEKEESHLGVHHHDLERRGDGPPAQCSLQHNRMHKISISKPGSYDQLCMQTHLPLPIPLPGEVLIQVSYFGINYADICVRMGLYESAKKYVGWPITPGFEFSGKIMAFGDNEQECIVEYTSTKSNSLVRRKLVVGMQVFGVTRFGAYTSHIAVPSRFVYQLPAKMSMEEAAGFPAVYLTAFYGMHELVHPRKNQWILVHSAAGGVGSVLVQLGKIAGCIVVGIVGSSHKVATVKQLGADHVIDKSKTDWIREVERMNVNGGEGFDVVFDANGVETLGKSYELMASGGKLVVYGFHTMLPRTGGKPNWLKLAWNWLWTPSFSPLQMTGANKSVLAFNLSYLFHKFDVFTEFMDHLLEYMDSGSLKPPKVTIYEDSLEQIRQAHIDIESGKTIGKLIVAVRLPHE